MLIYVKLVNGTDRPAYSKLTPNYYNLFIRGNRQREANPGHSNLNVDDLALRHDHSRSKLPILKLRLYMFIDAI